MKTAWITHPDCLLHENRPGNPETPERLRVIERRATELGIDRRITERIEAPRASREQLERAHGRDYVRHIFASSPASGRVELDYDTDMNCASLEAALRAAGAAVHATDLVLAGAVEAAFCNVRPPGHHAESDRAMGFCLFASVAIAALHALAGGRLSRVLVFDFDVHHGNGTEQILRGRDGLLMCSLYQCPLYPNHVAAAVPGHMVNVPLAAGSGARELRAAWASHWAPAITRFAPQMIFISAGFDAHREDPLGSLTMQAEDYAWLTTQLAATLDDRSSGGVVSVLEGGYHLEALADCACAHVSALIDA